jgi:DNA-binding SARP family transcriptional activator
MQPAVAGASLIRGYASSRGKADAVRADNLTFTVLGRISAWRAGEEISLGSPQQRTILACLLLARTRAVSVNELADWLWARDRPNAARTTVRTYIHRLRRLLDTDDDTALLQSVGGGYALRIDDEHLDLGRFEQATRDAAAAQRRGDRDTAAGLLLRAYSEWRGEPLADARGDHAATQRLHLNQLRLSTLEDLASLELASGRPEPALALLAAEIDREPLRERLHELLILGLYRAGRQAEALLAYDRVRRSLHDELGVDPGPGLQALYGRMLRPTPALLMDGRRNGGATVNQLPVANIGFVGREAEFEAMALLMSDLRERGVVVVHGAAGIGKTAFVVHWAHQVVDHFPGGVLYVDLHGFSAEEPIEPAIAVCRLLSAFAVPVDLVPDELDDKLALLNRLRGGGATLVLLDNAGDDSQVLPLLRGLVPDCFVVVTSRNKMTGLSIRVGARALQLGLLSHGDAMELVTRQVGGQGAAVERVVRACCGLPLALSAVCARIAFNPTLTVDAVADELLSLTDGLESGVCPDSAIDFRAMLFWSYRRLSDDGARLFRVLSTHDLRSFDVSVVVDLTGSSRLDARGRLRELTGAHLIEEHAPGQYGWPAFHRAYAATMFAADGGNERARRHHARGVPVDATT